MMNLLSKFVWAIAGVSIAIIVLGSVPVYADVVPDRRKDQFLKEPGHLIVPLPYSLPGIGTGIFLLGNVANIGGSTADFVGLLIFGDAEGTVGALQEVPIVSDRLLFDVIYQDISKAQASFYETRGMDSDRTDFKLLDLQDIRTTFAKLSLSFFDRRLELFTAYETSESKVSAVRDSKGDIITEPDKPFKSESDNQFSGVTIDLTDDNQDPRLGVRLDWEYFGKDAVSDEEADSFVVNYNLTAYVPVGDISTWAFNYFRSDANVTRQGETDPTAIRAELGFDCGVDSACLEAEQEAVDLFTAQRKNGSSISLGGLDRLRSYPGGRFRGAHTEFYGTEFRWNLTEEFTPFDYFIWKDTRTGVQIAFFAETGTVAETTGDLWKESRSSYGAGIRMVTGSGSVYRFDVANGEEGSEVTIFFFYPWQPDAP